LRSTLSAMVHRGKRLAFSTWTLAARSRKTHLLFKKAVTAFRHGSTRKAFASWAEQREHGRTALTQMRMVARSLRMRGARLVFNSWIEMAHERAFHLARLREAFFALRHAGARKALRTWFGLARERARLRAFGTALRHSGLRRAWSTWEGESTEHQRFQKLLTLGIPLCHFGMRRAWITWEGMSTESRAAFELADEVQNASLQQLEMLITARLGSRSLLCEVGETPSRSRSHVTAAIGTRWALINPPRRAIVVWAAHSRALRAARRASRFLVAMSTRLCRTEAQRSAFGSWAHSWRRGVQSERLKAAALSAAHATTHGALLQQLLRCALLQWGRVAHRRARMLATVELGRERRNAVSGAEQLEARLAESEAEGRLLVLELKAQAEEAELVLARVVSELEARAEEAAHALDKAQAAAHEANARGDDERRKRLAAEAEASFLRGALGNARELSSEASAKASRFDEAYRRLWRATHDPNYIESTSPTTNKSPTRSRTSSMRTSPTRTPSSGRTPSSARSFKIEARSSALLAYRAKTTLEAALALQRTLGDRDDGTSPPDSGISPGKTTTGKKSMGGTVGVARAVGW